MTLASVKRYEGAAATPTRGRHAVVVGGSIAGLCVARVLADAFESVTVFERDEFSSAPAPREGAPQTGHPHVLLEAGRATLEDFFPGFGEDLLSAGGLLVDSSRDLVWHDQGGVLAPTTDRFPTYCASRPLFEHVIRERVADHANVTLRGGCRVRDYSLDGDAVTGVTVRESDGTDSRVDADLVVDASGRTSRVPRWLSEHGYPAPDVDEVAVDVTYSTIRIDRPPTDRRVLLCAPQPDRPRGAAVLPIENGQWEVIFQSLHGEASPADAGAFREWAESFPVDDVARLVTERAWTADGIRRYPFPASVRRHYERLSQFPNRLVVVGDAIASFNPIYGQGMSVAALDALALHHELAAGLPGLAPRFFDRAGRVVDQVWLLAVGNDFTFPATTGPKPRGTDVFNRYVARLVRRAHHDGELTAAFFRVFRLEKPATSLLRPRVLWRVYGPAHDTMSTGDHPALHGPTGRSRE